MHPDQAADVAVAITRLCLGHGVTGVAPGQPQTLDTVLALYKGAFDGLLKVGGGLSDNGAAWLAGLEDGSGMTVGGSE
jgi:hypothetical protein